MEDNRNEPYKQNRDNASDTINTSNMERILERKHPADHTKDNAKMVPRWRYQVCKYETGICL